MQPVPVTPTNVQRTNPYVGKDRGLFLIHEPADQYARVHAARWRSVGPNAAVGRLEYQIMIYQAMPVSDADYLNGTLLKAPDGSEWFDCLTRQLVLEPIIAEYWGKHSYKTWYAEADAPAKLLPEEITLAESQAQSFVTTMGQWAGLHNVELIATYNVSSGHPLQRTSLTLNFSYGTPTQHVTIVDWPKDPVDPVQSALAYIRAHKQPPQA